MSVPRSSPGRLDVGNTQLPAGHSLLLAQRPGPRPQESAAFVAQASATSAALRARLSAFLPALAAANAEVATRIATDGPQAVDVEAVQEGEAHVLMNVAIAELAPGVSLEGEEDAEGAGVDGVGLPGGRRQPKIQLVHSHAQAAGAGAGAGAGMEQEDSSSDSDDSSDEDDSDSDEDLVGGAGAGAGGGAGAGAGEGAGGRTKRKGRHGIDTAGGLPTRTWITDPSALQAHQAHILAQLLAGQYADAQGEEEEYEEEEEEEEEEDEGEGQ